MPRGSLSQRKTAEQLLNSISRFASAVDVAGGGSLTSLPPGLKLSELSRHLRELAGLLKGDSSINALAALRTSPQARVALIQLHAAALQLATDPWGTRPLDASAAPASPAPAPEPAGTTDKANKATAGAAGSKAVDHRDADVNAERAFAVLVDVSHILFIYVAGLISERGPRVWDHQSDVMKPPGRDVKLHTSVMLKTETLPALSRLLTAMAPANEDGGRQRPTAALPLLSARDADVIFGQLPLWGTVATTDRTLFLDLVHSLTSSSLLEHLSKAAAPRAAAGAGAAAAPSATVSLRPSSTSGGPRSVFQEALQSMLVMLRPGDGPPAPLGGVLSGPCLQYFAAAQAVSQLHAADGGPLYGLPYDALLPPALADPANDPPGNQTAKQRQQRSSLSTTGVASSISWQACLAQEPPVPLGPLRRRHLVALCLRAARVALDSLDMQEEEWKQQGPLEQRGRRGQRQRATSSSSTGGVSSGSLGDTHRAGRLGRPFEVEYCGGLALDSLELAAMVLGGAKGSRGTEGGGDSSSGDSGLRVVEGASGSGAGSAAGFVHSDDGGGSSNSVRDSHAAPPPAARPDPRLHHAPSAARWWPLAVRGVRTMLLWQPEDSAPSASLFQQFCLLLQLDGRTDAKELESWPKDVPSTPPAGLPHALSAGYIPTYEALLRAACRSPELSLPASTASGSAGSNSTMAQVAARKATRLLRSLLLVAPGSKLLLLLGEGDPREAAALATTLCKAHLQHAELAAKAGSREGLQQAAGMVTGLARVMHRGLLREQGRPRVSMAEVEVQEALGEQGGDGDWAGGGGGYSGGSGGGSGARSRGSGGDGSSAPGGVDGDASDSRSGGFTAVASTGAEMHRLGLSSYLLPRLLPVVARIGSLCFAAGLGGSSEELRSLARTRRRLQEHTASGKAFAAAHEGYKEQRSWSQLQWDDLGADNVAVCMGAGVGLPEAQAASGRAEGGVAGNEAGGCERQEEVIQDEDWRLWGELVPHAPSLAALLLPTCSNPLCVNMHGDSEAGVKFRVTLRHEQEAEAPAMLYCSMSCQQHHAEQMDAVRRWQMQPREDCSTCKWCRAARYVRK